MTTIRTLKPLALAAVLSIGTAACAFAQADEAMLARFKSYAAEQGSKLEWSKTEEFENDKGEAVTSLIDVKVTSEGKQFPVPQIDLVDVTEEDGGWHIGSVQVPSMTYTEDETEVWLSDVSVDGLVLPPAGQDENAEATPTYDSASLGEVQVRVKGKDAFTMNDFHIEVTPPEDNGPVEFSGAAEAFHISLDGVEDAESRAAIQKMGYQQLDGYLEIEGSWDKTAGDLSLGTFDINVKDAGTFGISLDLGGYTPELMASLRKLQAQNAANPDDKSATGIALLGLMQQLTFQSARIEFTDDSLTGRALDFVASQQGSKPADVANQAKALVPFAMMQLNNPELTQMVTQAVSAFLDNPKNFAIVAQPPAPVPFAMIAAGAMGAPQTLPQQLGVKVLANE